MTRLLLALVCLLFAACGRAPRVDPPLFTYPTQAMVTESARLHARDTGGFVTLPVANTHSMEPLIHGGDLLVVVATPFGSRLSGRVIGYHPGWDPSLFVVHRVVAEDSYGLIVEGDNVAAGHSENRFRVTTANYVGEVTAIYRFQP